MSSKKKQGVSADKKKYSLFNVNKAKSSAADKNGEKGSEPSAAAAEIIDTAMAAAVLHTGDAEKPSSSNKGQIKKLTKFFKKGNIAHPKKASKKANVATTDHQQKLAENEETTIIAEASGEKKNDTKEGSEPGDVEKRREKAATKIQAVFRGHNERRKYKLKRQNVIKIEAVARGFLARKQASSTKTFPSSTPDDNTPTSTTEVEKKAMKEVQSENLITFS